MVARVSTCMILVDEAISLQHPSIQALACILGPSQVKPLEECDTFSGYSRVLICAFPSSGRKLMHFVLKNLPILAGKPVGLINLSEDADPGWIPDVVALLGCSGQNAAVIALSAPAEKFIDYALAFSISRHQPGSEMPRKELRNCIEDFLISHNTCTLSTSYQGKSFSAPLEYRYCDGHLYCLSEGGEKFAGILHNHRVSVAVFEPFSGFDRLAGMQIRGKADLVLPESIHYARIIDLWNGPARPLDEERMPLYAIEIKLLEVVFLWEGFRKKGLQTRQVYLF
jgi:hypothetical protein